MSRFLYETSVGFIAWTMAGLCWVSLNKIGEDNGIWWALIAALSSFLFWVALDWHANVKGKAK